MTELRKRMLKEVPLCNYFPETQCTYIAPVARFARYFAPPEPVSMGLLLSYASQPVAPSIPLTNSPPRAAPPAAFCPRAES
jgi:hypothetical protein